MLDYEIVGFSIQFLLSSPAFPAIASDAAEIAQIEDGDGLAVSALRLEVAGDIGIQCGDKPAAMRAAQLTLGQVEAFPVGTLQLVPHLRREGLALVLPDRRRLHHKPPPKHISLSIYSEMFR